MPQFKLQFRQATRALFRPLIILGVNLGMAIITLPTAPLL